MGGGGGGGSGPTLQQQQLETQQALTNANLNLEENSQRKTILNAMQGTRVFRGSALSRALAGNNNAPGVAPGPSTAQVNSYGQLVTAPQTSLLDTRAGKSSSGAAANPSASPSAGTRIGGGGYRGGERP
jgi:hypothetical protein